MAAPFTIFFCGFPLNGGKRVTASLWKWIHLSTVISETYHLKKKKIVCFVFLVAHLYDSLSKYLLSYMIQSSQWVSPTTFFFHILIVKFIQISTYQPIMGLLNSVRTVVDLLLRKTRTEHLTGDIRYNKQVIRFNVLWSSVYVSMNNFKETALFFSWSTCPQLKFNT